MYLVDMENHKKLVNGFFSKIQVLPVYLDCYPRILLDSWANFLFGRTIAVVCFSFKGF
jgi:hypothetical protein